MSAIEQDQSTYVYDRKFSVFDPITVYKTAEYMSWSPGESLDRDPPEESVISLIERMARLRVANDAILNPAVHQDEKVEEARRQRYQLQLYIEASEVVELMGWTVKPAIGEDAMANALKAGDLALTLHRDEQDGIKSSARRANTVRRLQRIIRWQRSQNTLPNPEDEYARTQ